MDHYITIVSGLPRTGTSMMMRMLAAGGIDAVTDNIRTADEDNPEGYFEFELVKKIKDDKSWLAGTEGKVFKMVSMLLYDLPPGFEYKVVFMERDMSELLASQKKMLQRKGLDTSDEDDEKTRRLYERHLGEIRDWLKRQKNISVLYVSYNSLLREPARYAQEVNGFLDNRLDAAKMSGVVNHALYRNRAGDIPG